MPPRLPSAAGHQGAQGGLLAVRLVAMLWLWSACTLSLFHLERNSRVKHTCMCLLCVRLRLLISSISSAPLLCSLRRACASPLWDLYWRVIPLVFVCCPPQFEARVVLLETPVPLLKGRSVTVHAHVAREAGHVSALTAMLSARTGEVAKAKPR